jgi:tRNA threonylcarbamoyladenosine biosynthesis protein TsaE
MKIKFHKKEISKISKKILDKAVKIKSNKARVVALSGNLGAGKTTLTQELAKLLKVKENIVSPTFVIMKIYKINSSKYKNYFKQMVHIDAYRLESSDELTKIGWEELEGNKDNLIIIEWPENVKKHLKDDAYWIKLEHKDDQTRVVEF